MKEFGCNCPMLGTRRDCPIHGDTGWLKEMMGDQESMVRRVVREELERAKQENK